jgi:hypothetical protein
LVEARHNVTSVFGQIFSPMQGPVEVFGEQEFGEQVFGANEL